MVQQQILRVKAKRGRRVSDAEPELTWPAPRTVRCTEDDCDEFLDRCEQVLSHVD